MAALTKQVARYPDLGLQELDVGGLDERDAAFAHALYDAVMRRWITLAYVLEKSLQRPEARVPPRAVAAIFTGMAQMLFLDRVPVHAAVHTAVEWTKKSGGVGPAGLVNAILRGVASRLPEGVKEKRAVYSDGLDEIPLSDGSCLALPELVLPTDPLSRLAVATSTPIELLRTWSKQRGVRETKRLAMHSLVVPPTILNTAYAGAPLPQTCVPHTLPGHHVWAGTHAELTEFLAARRDVWVQDPASSLAVESAADMSPSLIIDACAGLGTKTRQLCAAFPNAKVIAADVDKVRVRALQRSVDPERVQVVPYQSLIEFAGKADLVLLDVPCSNTGVLARRVEARYRFDRAHLESLAAAQRQIIADSIRLPSRRGAILYSTCSLDPAENADQARWTSRWHGLKPEREHDRLPQGSPGDEPAKYSDGSYAALLR